MTKKPTGKSRGRPSTKIKLKHNPKSARQDFLKKFKDIDSIGIYGLDGFTTEIISYLWENPEISFHVTDNNRSRLDNSNRLFGQRSFSMYRWNVYPESGFIEQPIVNVILVAKDCWEEVSERPNPYKVDLLMLEDI